MQRIGAMLLRRAVPLLAVTVLGMLASTGAANAASFTVTTTNDSNDGACTASLCSLRDAVVAADAAGGASTITVPAGTYKLTIASTAPTDPTNGDLDINSGDNGASVTINGAGSGSTIIDANNIDRAFSVQKGGSLTLSGMTIRNGNPSSSSSGDQYGGAIYSDGALTVTGDVTFKDNNSFAGEYGGAIYTDYDQTVFSLTGATFEDNEADYGGAIYLNTYTNEDTVQQSITDSTFISNNAPDEEGGAINLEYGNLTVSHSTFTGNTSNDGDGGAIYEDTDSGQRLTLTDSTFDSNSAYYGGVLYYEYGNLTASGNTFSRNSGEYGGAIYQEEDDATNGNASVSNNTFDHNSAYDGGVLYNEYDYVVMSFYNNTLARNQASDEGGGIQYPGYVGTGSIYANNVVAENVGGDCYTDSGTYSITPAEDPGNNLDGDASCFGANGGDLTNVNPDLGLLADNGGPTETDALLSGSPAIDAGNNSQCPATDQRGVPRPQGTHCDIGAFEAAASALSVSNSAPSNGVTNQPFTYTIKVTPNGPGPSTGTTVTDQLPAGETLYGATPSQGSCSSSGTPAKVTCALGSINNGSNATVTLLVTEANAGSVSDTATASNDQGANVSASATTNLVAPVAPAGATGPKAGTDGHSHVGKHSAKVKGHVSNGSQPTWFFFQYGRSRKLGSASKLVRISSSSNVSATIRHLLSGKKYFYRLVAINDSGKSFGSIHSFRTKHAKHHHHHH
jgi:CSLREA domain-containing protein/uncharacterized repeat protein (TIGR01451 family)